MVRNHHESGIDEFLHGGELPGAELFFRHGPVALGEAEQALTGGGVLRVKLQDLPVFLQGILPGGSVQPILSEQGFGLRQPRPDVLFAAPAQLQSLDFLPQGQEFGVSRRQHQTFGHQTASQGGVAPVHGLIGTVQE